MFDISDATINTGVFRPKRHASVWLFVTGEKPSDRIQYTDLLEGDTLHWDGQTSGRTDHMIIEHRERGLELLLFYRKTKTEHPGAGFRYEGPFKYIAHTGTHPTHFTLRRVSGLVEAVTEDLEALRAEEEYLEGEKSSRFTNYYERDPKLRIATIRNHGLRCMACSFDFGKVYGERGAGYIEVHHLRPVSSLSERTRVDPKTDMAVVCANCHRMIHRRRDHILSIEELRQIIRK